MQADWSLNCLKGPDELGIQVLRAINGLRITSRGKNSKGRDPETRRDTTALHLPCPIVPTAVGHGMYDSVRAATGVI
jgi:hypothetical protein